MGYRNYGPANGFIVAKDGNGDFLTIASALTAAASAPTGTTIFIRPGTYTENITLVAGINLAGLADSGINSGNPVIIKGNTTMTSVSSSKVQIDNIEFQTNGAACITASNSNFLNLFRCTISTNTVGVGAAIIFNGCSISLYQCNGICSGIDPFFAGTATAIRFQGCNFSGTSSNANTLVGGAGATFFNSSFQGFITTSGTLSQVTAYMCDLGVANATFLTTAGTATTNEIANSRIVSGSSSALSIGTSTTLTVTNTSINSTNTNAITGAGTLQYSNLSFTGSSSLINTTTQVPLVSSNDAVRITSPGAYPYTTIPQDGVILVDTASSRTIVPLASPTTGQMHRIKDNVGSAAANNITITPSGKNIDGSASFVINNNFGSVDIVYNGTQWNCL